MFSTFFRKDAQADYSKSVKDEKEINPMIMSKIDDIEKHTGVNMSYNANIYPVSADSKGDRSYFTERGWGSVVKERPLLYGSSVILKTEFKNIEVLASKAAEEVRSVCIEGRVNGFQKIKHNKEIEAIIWSLKEFEECNSNAIFDETYNVLLSGDFSKVVDSGYITEREVAACIVFLNDKRVEENIAVSFNDQVEAVGVLPTIGQFQEMSLEELINNWNTEPIKKLCNMIDNCEEKTNAKENAELMALCYLTTEEMEVQPSMRQALCSVLIRLCILKSRYHAEDTYQQIIYNKLSKQSVFRFIYLVSGVRSVTNTNNLFVTACRIMWTYFDQDKVKKLYVSIAGVSIKSVNTQLPENEYMELCIILSKIKANVFERLIEICFKGVNDCEDPLENIQNKAKVISCSIRSLNHGFSRGIAIRSLWMGSKRKDALAFRQKTVRGAEYKWTVGCFSVNHAYQMSMTSMLVNMPADESEMITYLGMDDRYKIINLRKGDKEEEIIVKNWSGYKMYGKTVWNK